MGENNVLYKVVSILVIVGANNNETGDKRISSYLLPAKTHSTVKQFNLTEMRTLEKERYL